MKFREIFDSLDKGRAVWCIREDACGKNIRVLRKMHVTYRFGNESVSKAELRHFFANIKPDNRDYINKSLESFNNWEKYIYLESEDLEAEWFDLEENSEWEKQ